MYSHFSYLFEKIKRIWREPREHNLIRNSALFDKAWYLSYNPDVARAKIDPSLHFLRYGGMEERDPGPNFSSAYYLSTYPDVKAAGVNPLVHFFVIWRKRGQTPPAALSMPCVLQKSC